MLNNILNDWFKITVVGRFVAGLSALPISIQPTAREINVQNIKQLDEKTNLVEDKCRKRATIPQRKILMN